MLNLCPFAFVTEVSFLLPNAELLFTHVFFFLVFLPCCEFRVLPGEQEVWLGDQLPHTGSGALFGLSFLGLKQGSGGRRGAVLLESFVSST